MYEPTGLALEIFRSRHAAHDKETWQEASDRVAFQVSAAESGEARDTWRDKFAWALKHNLFMPGGRIWYGSGRPRPSLLNCVSGDTLVHTRRGLVPARDLAGVTVDTLSQDGVYRPAKWASYGVQELCLVEFENGDTVLATPGHQWVVTPNGHSRNDQRVTTMELEGRMVPMQHVSPGERDCMFDSEQYRVGVQHGLVYGDGTVNHTGKAHLLQFGDSRHLVEDWFDGYTIQHHKRYPEGVHYVGTLPATWKTTMPSVSTHGTSYVFGFIAGYIAADGNVDNRGSVSLFSAKKADLVAIRRMAAEVGLPTTSITMSRELSPFDGEPAPMYCLRFSKAGVDPRLILKNKHREYLANAPSAYRTTMKVVRVTSTGRHEEVYCCEEPQTHTWVAGMGYLTGNCYVVPTEDSREGWGKTVSDTIVISGTGGGVGCNFSPSRPRGQKIRGTGGESTGAVSEMEMVNGVGNTIKAGGGRRVALMFCLSLSHGDIVEFLDKKLDKDVLNNANVSVVFDEDPEEFFELVKKNAEWPLVHQGRQVGAIPARVLWERIVKNALEGGEPGILNGYLANKMSNIWYVEKLTSTNPCFHPDTRIATDKGQIKIKDLVAMGRTARVVADSRVGKGDVLDASKFGTRVLPAIDVELKQKNAPVFKVTTEHGYTVTATAEHDFITTNGRKKLKDLAEGDVLMLPSGEGAFGETGTLEEGRILGLWVGDGTRDVYEGGRAYVSVWDEDAADMPYIGDTVNTVIAKMPTYGNGGRDYGRLDWNETSNQHRIGGARLDRWLASQADGERVSTLKERVPESVWRGSRDFVRGYLQGLFYADGSVNVCSDTVYLRLAQSNKSLLEDVQLLLTQFGVVSRLYLRRAASVKPMPDGRGGQKDYAYKDQYELVLNRSNLLTFMSKLELWGRKKARAEDALAEFDNRTRKPERYTTTITNIEPAGTTDVYCLTQPETNSLVSSGIVNGNCGEIWMSPYDCCCLGAVVLPRFVIGGEVDWSMLKDVVRTGVRFLDDVLTVNTYPLPEIKAKCEQLRRIGLGVTGLHHMLLELGLKYNSPEGLEFVDKLMARIKNWAYEASSDLAVEKGSFPAFDADKFLKSGFAKTLKPSLRSKLRRDGMRNCATMTIAPVGTGSIICNTTSGIEPMYAPAFKRTFRKGDDLASEELVDPMFQDFVNQGRDVSHFVGAMDLSIRDHMEMQRVCQRHVDNAVSKTINLPAGTSAEELSDLYMEFVGDLKGVTVYPDGSRADQPLTSLPLERAVELAKAKLSDLQAAGFDPCRSGNCDV